MRGTDADDSQARLLRKRAADAYYFTLYLPYFSVKPGYVLAMEFAHRLGANLIDASRGVSAVCFFGIAVTLWMFTRSLLALVVLILPEVLFLGQANEPDGMSIMFLLLGLWAVFIKQRKWGILPMILAVWIRPDNVVLVLVTLAFLWVVGELRWRECAVLMALAAGSEIFISHFGYSWRELYFHTFLGGEPGQNAQFAWADYGYALRSGLLAVVHSSAVIYGLLWAVCFARSKDRDWKRVLGIVGFASLAHFVIFPNYEARYYGLLFVITATAAVRAIAKPRTVGSEGR